MNVKSKLKSDKDWATLEQDYDVVEFLNKLKEMDFLTSGVQEPYWALQHALRRLMGTHQGAGEPLDNYFKRFWATVEVIEAQWGKFRPSGLAASGSKADTDKARDKTIAMIFLAVGGI